MKKIMLVLLASIIVTSPCMAINKEWSAALGFLGGVLTTKALDNCNRHVEYRQYPNVYYVNPQPTTIIYTQPSGHWEVIQEKIWIEGTWVYEQICHNTYKKVWKEGYYKIVERRIWVNY